MSHFRLEKASSLWYEAITRATVTKIQKTNKKLKYNSHKMNLKKHLLDEESGRRGRRRRTARRGVACDVGLSL